MYESLVREALSLTVSPQGLADLPNVCLSRNLGNQKMNNTILPDYL